jgi:selenide,water dikinase
VATNAVSDIYAMGGRPLFGLNIACWNHAALGSDMLVEVLSGAAAVAAEGGWLLVGGHTVDDPEPKVGVAVVGEVDPQRMLTSAGMRPGDALVLTKPLGVGIATTALKAGRAPTPVMEAALDSMLRTNAAAATVALECDASAATDVTGFGLLGHLRSMLAASHVDAVIDVGAVPVLDGVTDLAAAGLVPGGTGRNLAWIDERLDRGGHPAAVLDVLADPQTSGGLLFATQPATAAEAVARLRDSGHDAAVVGRAEAGDGVTHLR